MSLATLIHRASLVSKKPSEAYAQGMVFQLDCFSGITYDSNNIPTKWTDLIGGREFDLVNVTQDATTKGLVFDGTAKGTTTNDIPWQPGSGTIEAVFTLEGGTYNAPILSNNVSGYYILHMAVGTSGEILNRVYICPRIATNAAVDRKYSSLFPGKYTDSDFPHFTTAYVSCTAYNESETTYVGKTLFNGSYMSEYCSNVVSRTNYSRVGIGYKNTSKGESYHTGKIFAIRIYNRRLSEEEQLHNYQLDRERFNV